MTIKSSLSDNDAEKGVLGRSVRRSAAARLDVLGPSRTRAPVNQYYMVAAPTVTVAG